MRFWRWIVSAGQYNPGMRRIILSLVTVALTFGASKTPAGHGEDGLVSIDATVLTQEQIKEAVGSNFGGVYTVLEVRVAPKGGKPYDIHYDDFILRSEASGEHSGPLYAGQVAGAGEVIVKRTYANRSNPESPALLNGMKVETKDDLGDGSLLGAVKKKVLSEGTATDAATGLLFFPLEKEKPKNLVLSCTTPEGKFRIQFR